MAFEHLRAYSFIYDILHGDATLLSAPPNGVSGRIMPENAPQGLAYPFITYAYMGGGDLIVLGGVRVLNNGLYLVKVEGQTTTYADISPVADRFDLLLHGRKGRAGADGMVFSCIREQPIPIEPAFIDSKWYRTIAAEYRITVQV